MARAFVRVVRAASRSASVRLEYASSKLIVCPFFSKLRMPVSSGAFQRASVARMRSATTNAGKLAVVPSQVASRGALASLRADSPEREERSKALGDAKGSCVTGARLAFPWRLVRTPVRAMSACASWSLLAGMAAAGWLLAGLASAGFMLSNWTRLRRSNLSSREEMMQRRLLVRQRLGSKPENKAM